MMRTAGEERTEVEGSYRDSMAGVGASALLPQQIASANIEVLRTVLVVVLLDLSCRINSDFAAQPGLGVLSKQGSGSCPLDYSGAFPHGPALTKMPGLVSGAVRGGMFRLGSNAQMDHRRDSRGLTAARGRAVCAPSEASCHSAQSY